MQGGALSTSLRKREGGSLLARPPSSCDSQDYSARVKRKRCSVNRSGCSSKGKGEKQGQAAGQSPCAPRSYLIPIRGQEKGNIGPTHRGLEREKKKKKDKEEIAPVKRAITEPTCNKERVRELRHSMFHQREKRGEKKRRNSSFAVPVHAAPRSRAKKRIGRRIVMQTRSEKNMKKKSRKRYASLSI